jgi:hypothetical protein
MGTTYLHAVASLDGDIADERDDVGPLHDWYFNGDHPVVFGRGKPYLGTLAHGHLLLEGTPRWSSRATGSSTCAIRCVGEAGRSPRVRRGSAPDRRAA